MGIVQDHETRAKPFVERVQVAWRLANVEYMEGLMARIDVAETRADQYEERIEHLQATIEFQNDLITQLHKEIDNGQSNKSDTRKSRKKSTKVRR